MFNDNSIQKLTAYMNKNFRNLQRFVDLEDPNTRTALETIIKKHILRNKFVSNSMIAIRIAKAFIYLARKQYLASLSAELAAITVPEYPGLNSAIAPYHIY